MDLEIIGAVIIIGTILAEPIILPFVQLTDDEKYKISELVAALPKPINGETRESGMRAMNTFIKNNPSCFFNYKKKLYSKEFVKHGEKGKNIYVMLAERIRQIEQEQKTKNNHEKKEKHLTRLVCKLMGKRNADSLIR